MDEEREEEDRDPPADDDREPPQARCDGPADGDGSAPPGDEGLAGEDDDPQLDEGQLDELRRIPSEELAMLFEQFYRELHDIAARLMRGQGVAHTLQPTALIHEAFLKLFGWSTRRWKDSGHFLAIAARAMRHVLLDHARRKKTGKRRLLGDRVPLDELLGAAPGNSFEDLEALHKALETLHEIRPRCAQIVDMLYFLFLPRDEASELCKESLGISQRTLEREFAFAKAWLRTRIG